MSSREFSGVLASLPPSTKVAQIYLFFPFWQEMFRKIFYFIPRRLLFVFLARSSSGRICTGRVGSIFYIEVFITTLHTFYSFFFFFMRLYDSKVGWCLPLFPTEQGILAHYCQKEATGVN